MCACVHACRAEDALNLRIDVLFPVNYPCSREVRVRVLSCAGGSGGGVQCTTLLFIFL